MSDEQALQTKLQNAVNNMIEKLEKDKLRPVNHAAYLKIANCYSSKTASAEEVERCARPQVELMQASAQLISQEMEGFQQRLNRCSTSCGDEMQEMIYKKGRDYAETSEGRKKYFDCTANCVDNSIALLASIRSKLDKDLDSLARRK